MSSQLAVWVVERLFDMGAFALIMAVNIIVFADRLKELDGFQHHAAAFNVFKMSAFGLLIAVVLASVFALRMRRNPVRAARVVEKLFGHISQPIGKALAHRVQTFGEGLNTIRDGRSFVQILCLSLVLWLTIGASYLCVTHAYADIGGDMRLYSCFLLTGASVAGGALQLPAVGGGSQLATIGMLVGVFGYPKELAISCGIMLWLVTFMSVIPAGLVLAHFEHISLMKAEKESLEVEREMRG